MRALGCERSYIGTLGFGCSAATEQASQLKAASRARNNVANGAGLCSKYDPTNGERHPGSGGTARVHIVCKETVYSLALLA